MTTASRLLLGCVADDFTGATDLGSTLARNGMRVVQVIGAPEDSLPAPEADAIVVALKSRTAPVAVAVADSLAASRWLTRHGARQIFFKYCSTFDSTDQGNIGPVADALRADLGAGIVPVCPAFPENGRTIYQGHLFVGGQLLSDSPMRHHPLTPMTDANLVRVMARQSRGPVDCVPYRVVRQGAGAIHRDLVALQARDIAYAVIDALDDDNLRDLGAACADLPLATGGSGAAMGLPENFRRAGLLPTRDQVEPLPAVGGAAIVLSGSCSPATLAQIARLQATHPSHRLDPLVLATEGGDAIDEALAWAQEHLARGPALIYASAPPEEVKSVQTALGRDRAGAVVEHALAAIATRLVKAGLRRLVVAGGETSGAVVQALGIRTLRIGPQIDPGVPATLALTDPPLALALKSGNFGGEDFFLKAIGMLR